jgi:hypothetical protein
MSREAHVRICEGLGVQFPRAYSVQPATAVPTAIANYESEATCIHGLSCYEDCYTPSHIRDHLGE